MSGAPQGYTPHPENPIEIRQAFQRLNRRLTGVYYEDGTLYVDAAKTGNGHVVMLNLPTSDPAVAGALWNDAGTIKISSG